MILTERHFRHSGRITQFKRERCLSPALTNWMPLVDRPAIEPNVTTIAMQFDLLLCGIVAALAQTL
jgi:hypothetical protein